MLLDKLRALSPNIKRVVHLQPKMALTLKQPLQEDTLSLSEVVILERKINKILSGKKKFDIADYKKLAPTDVDFLKNALPQEIQVAAHNSVNVALDLKEYLDAVYGEDKYVFCCIGTSPTGVARAFEFMGVETKYLPISGLSWLRAGDEEFQYYRMQFPNYKEFLAQQGLTKEQMEKSGKKYLFFDYTNSGKSLRLFEKLMRSELGADSENSEYLSLNSTLSKNSFFNMYKRTRAVDYELYYLKSSKIAKFGGVPHLEIEFIDRIFKVKDPNKESAKRFNFFVIDKLNEKGLLKENPANKGVL